MLFGTVGRSSRFLVEKGSGFKQTIFGEITLLVNDLGRGSRGLFTSDENGITFTSEAPYVRTETGYQTILKSEGNLADLVPKAENNFATFQLQNGVDGWSAYASSARITRARIYFLFVEEGILWSDDLRELIPYSTREMNPMGAFSILKYGDVPEYITVVKGIHCIPVGQALKFGQKEFDEWLKLGKITRTAFNFFFNLDFPMDGGDIPKTEKLLDAEFEFVASLNPIVPISGGVDSTLANCLINKFIDKPYPAYYIQFGEDDPEVKFAREAAKASKAELEIALFTPEDTIPSFEYQNEHAIQPIGESSTISTAYHFRNQKHAGHKIIDGTLADGCYGSTNYNRSIIGDIPERPQWQQQLNEWIAAQLQSRKLPGYQRFHPRDSYINDPYLQFMDVYLGPFGNMWLKDSKKHSDGLLPLWQYYYDYLKPDKSKQDDWMKYSVFKMVNYACKNNTAKSYDNSQPENSGLYPFTWKSILEDQGHYSWAEKTLENTIKYPLKKILDRYMSKDFIYRKKVGLNSCFEDWIHLPFLKDHFSKIISRPNGVAEYFLGSRKNYLLELYSKSEPLHPNLARMVINMSILDAWLERHNISIS
jgi:hypothetical protein